MIRELVTACIVVLAFAAGWCMHAANMWEGYNWNELWVLIKGRAFRK